MKLSDRRLPFLQMPLTFHGQFKGFGCRSAFGVHLILLWSLLRDMTPFHHFSNRKNPMQSLLAPRKYVSDRNMEARCRVPQPNRPGHRSSRLIGRRKKAVICMALS